MKIRNGILFILTICICGGMLWASSAQAAQMSIASFPDKLIVSPHDNRVIAFIVEKDGIRVPEAQVKASIIFGSGRLNLSCESDGCEALDVSSCRTDESGQCLFSYIAPEVLGKGKIKATASMADAQDGTVTVDIDVVETPTLSGSGWQCDMDAAVYAQIPETINCSDACSLEKDCKGSKCPTGGDIYCHSAQEACDCGGIEMVKGARTQATDTETDGAVKTDKTVAGLQNTNAGSIVVIVLFLSAITGLIYIIAHRRKDNPKK
ncbi:MAG: hypothetical protein PHX30_04790 [Candidatus Pacebacteria bacterium]|nr:hypothetical protein [Candidatus Paceibacterota bacterium]